MMSPFLKKDMPWQVFLQRFFISLPMDPKNR